MQPFHTPLPNPSSRNGEFLQPQASPHPVPPFWGYATAPPWHNDPFVITNSQEPHMPVLFEGATGSNRLFDVERGNPHHSNPLINPYFIQPSNGFHVENQFHFAPNNPNSIEIQYRSNHQQSTPLELNVHPSMFNYHHKNGYHKANLLSQQESQEHGAKLLSFIQSNSSKPSSAASLLNQPSSNSTVRPLHGSKPPKSDPILPTPLINRAVETSKPQFTNTILSSAPSGRQDDIHTIKSESIKRNGTSEHGMNAFNSEFKSMNMDKLTNNDPIDSVRIQTLPNPIDSNSVNSQNAAAVQSSFPVDVSVHFPPASLPPSGSINPDDIRNKEYYDRQFRSNKKVIPEYVDYLCSQETKKLILDHYFGSMDANVTADTSDVKGNQALEKEAVRKNSESSEKSVQKLNHSSNSKKERNVQQPQWKEKREGKQSVNSLTAPSSKAKPELNPQTNPNLKPNLIPNLIPNLNPNPNLSLKFIQNPESRTVHENQSLAIHALSSNSLVGVKLNVTDSNGMYDNRKNILRNDIIQINSNSKHIHEKPISEIKERKKHHLNMQYRKDMTQITSNLHKIYDSLIPTKEEKQLHHNFLSELKGIISREWKDAQLFPYGSCANNFGLKNSDIDVCLKFDSLDIPKGEFVSNLAEVLVRHGMQDVQPLPHARVPVVKFKSRDGRVVCDVCVNNMLAIVNTKLLQDYSKIDSRLCQLAFLVKHWAKCRKVNEPYLGTLSSYAYVLMCIHFLQQTKPSILPCLQNMEHTYKAVIDDKSIGYYDQVQNLIHFGSANKERVGELLTSFFEYWAYEHDYKHDVISIRTGINLRKDEKGWTKKVGNERHLLCIEDPFDLSHDLGRVIDRNSIQLLRDEFRRAAEAIKRYKDPCIRLFEKVILVDKV